MYEKDELISLRGRAVQEYFFDFYWNFIGVGLIDIDTGIGEVIIPNNTEVTYKTKVSKEILDAYGSTRLIGFRTGKACQESKIIKSIQPIYYSSNADVCSNVLQKIDDELLSELPEYGASCSDSITELINMLQSDPS